MGVYLFGMILFPLIAVVATTWMMSQQARQGGINFFNNSSSEQSIFKLPMGSAKKNTDVKFLDKKPIDNEQKSDSSMPNASETRIINFMEKLMDRAKMTGELENTSTEPTYNGSINTNGNRNNGGDDTGAVVLVNTAKGITAAKILRNARSITKPLRDISMKFTRKIEKTEDETNKELEDVNKQKARKIVNISRNDLRINKQKGNTLENKIGRGRKIYI